MLARSAAGHTLVAGGNGVAVNFLIYIYICLRDLLLGTLSSVGEERERELINL